MYLEDWIIYLEEGINIQVFFMSGIKKLWSEIRYWLFILIILGFLFEMVASMMFYRKYTTGKFAIQHFASDLFSKPPDNEVQFSYEPWMMFRVADHHSSNVNVNGFERASSPSEYINTSSKDTVDIFFFGGSAMYGYNAADTQTIPSQIVKLIQKNNSVKSVRVRNFGIPHYYSKQQLMLLTALLFQDQKPDIVVFLSGMEDFYSARMLYYDRPFYSYALQQSFEGKMLQKRDPSFVDSTAQFYDDPPGVNADQFNNTLYNKYVSNLKNVSMLCDKAGIKSYFFCQPVPFYNFSAPVKETFKGNYARFERIYPMMEKNADSVHNLHFLGNMLKNETASAFIDGVNYSPGFSQKISAEIYETIKNDLQ